MKELTFETAYPGRFISAGHFEGKRLALTIERVFQEGLDAGDGKQDKIVVSFVGKKLQLVLNKTNAFCLKSMFGSRCADWQGKRVVWFPTTTTFGGKTVDCIRVYGSLDIEQDMPLTVPQGRKKPWVTTMHAVRPGARTSAPTPIPEPDPPILEAWSILGWDTATGNRDMVQFHADFPTASYLTHLSALIDEMNAREGSAQ